MVGEADPSSFMILYYQKGRSISVKLYGRFGLRASGQVKDRGGKPVLDSEALEDPTREWRSLPSWTIVPRCCGGAGKGGTGTPLLRTESPLGPEPCAWGASWQGQVGPEATAGVSPLQDGAARSVMPSWKSSSSTSRLWV